jgi:predicted  nucleic acid-binding Zn-ribbon protein
LKVDTKPFKGGRVNPDLAALLALQEDDSAMAAIDARLRELDERADALDGERRTVTAAVERAHASTESEEKKRRELALKIDEHRSIQERNLSTLDAVRKQRETQAAMTQVDVARRVLAQEESELQALNSRIVELRRAAEAMVQELDEVDRRQSAEREELARVRGDLEAELGEARAKRAAAAANVPRSILTKYERIRGREKSFALYQLRGAACGRCNTAIPLQRRNVMAAGRTIEVCEGCGVLLYTPG